MNRSNKKHLYTLTVVAIITLITVALIWWINTRNRAVAPTATTKEPTMNLNDLKPRTLQGTITKTLEQFSLTTTDGKEYHINDPSQLLDQLAQRRGVDSSLYTLEDVSVEGIISPKGSYGHMGFYEYQLTVVGVNEQ